MTRAQKKMTKFMLTYGDKGWQSFADDSETIECVCALHNLGIVRVNCETGQMRLISREKACRFLGLPIVYNSNITWEYDG